jgi:hypothetical protein
VCYTGNLQFPFKLQYSLNEPTNNSDSYSSVDIASRLQAGRLGFNSQQGQEIYLFSIATRPALGPIQPPVQATEAGRGHSPPSSAKVKNGIAI